ncbi:single-stranded DNA-binding protein [Candidatus Woesebacteria bacterium]|nr:single-stranded DNA-binding protein [Candidatus Woesebacteria bacterium]
MSARSLNKVLLIGNLTRDPNLRYTGTGTAVCSFGLATNRSWTSQDGGDKQEKVEYHNIVAWSKLADICGQLLHKGDKVFVEGRLQTREWKADDGADRRITEVVIDNMILLRSSSGASGEYAGDDMGEYGDSEDAAPAPKKRSSSKKQEKPVDDAADIADDVPF